MNDGFWRADMRRGIAINCPIPCFLTEENRPEYHSAGVAPMLIFCTEPARYSNAVTGLFWFLSFFRCYLWADNNTEKGEEEYIYETKTNKKKKEKYIWNEAIERCNIGYSLPVGRSVIKFFFFFGVIYFSGLGKWEMPSRRNESKTQVDCTLGLFVCAIRPVIPIGGR